jgi:hypothetical protein
MAFKTNLLESTGKFDAMMTNGFGIVTVMNAIVCDGLTAAQYATLTPYEIAYAPYMVNGELSTEDVTIKGDIKIKPICRLDTLKVANVTQEGPSKTVTGGQFANPLIKFGKSARLEMQDALGNGKAIAALCGGIVESDETSMVGLHFGEDFVGAKMIIGDSFFIDRKSGQQVPVKIVFYQFLPDSIFNLTQDAEGDATVFDMNGDLLTTVVQVGDEEGKAITHGLFYSIVDPEIDAPEYTTA